ncbi:gliding motility lipoprotein GldB [Rhodonellum sp.]|uniref:gliding motility lipoprotein GldB n=1 Tax=Rhodonellum sp. TaxID=2231180 RepID=UPI00271E6990|nr:gliding motility lipoprotein GldB [Rhodonellum sp.]MDO9551627.1 gliding motility lipoprotein GldB [Rhodonellum sp.]
MQKLRSAVICLIVGILLFSCKKKEEACSLDPEILKENIELKIERLEDQFFQAEKPEDLLFLLEEYPEFTDLYLQAKLYESKEVLATELFAIHQDTLMIELYTEVKKNYEDISDLETELLNAFKYIRYYFPEFKVPKVYTFVSGFSLDLLVHEDIIVIGLDYFLPAAHRFQPPDLPNYITKRYERDYLIPMIVTAISSRFNKTDLKQNTLLSEMIYYGKAFHFTKMMLPCTADDYIIGYSQKEVRACFDNEELIWAHFVENELLFETNPFVIRKYTGEAPATDEISPDAPGRIGRWLGWNIVDDYRFNNSVSLDELMSDTDTDRIFRQSGYKPRP